MIIPAGVSLNEFLMSTAVERVQADSAVMEVLMAATTVSSRAATPSRRAGRVPQAVIAQGEDFVREYIRRRATHQLGESPKCEGDMLR